VRKDRIAARSAVRPVMASYLWSRSNARACANAEENFGCAEEDSMSGVRGGVARHSFASALVGVDVDVDAWSVGDVGVGGSLTVGFAFCDCRRLGAVQSASIRSPDTIAPLNILVIGLDGTVLFAFTASRRRARSARGVNIGLPARILTTTLSSGTGGTFSLFASSSESSSVFATLARFRSAGRVGDDEGDASEVDGDGDTDW
jgi:hypothetical protein